MRITSWLHQFRQHAFGHGFATRRFQHRSRQARPALETLEHRVLLTPINASLLSSSQRIQANSYTLSNDDTAASNDHVIVDATMRSTGSGFGGGRLGIQAGDDITVNVGEVMFGNQSLTLEVDYYGGRGAVFPAPVDPDPGVGGTLTLNGAVTGSDIELFGHTDNDTFIISAAGIASSSNFTIDGWDGNDTATLDLTGATGVTLTRNSNTSSVLTFTRSGGGSETVTFRNVETINTTGVTPTLVDNAPPVWGTLPSAINIVKNTATGADLTNTALLSQLQTLVSDLDDSTLAFTANPTTFPTGTTSVVFTATDDAGNSANATINVVVGEATLTLDVAQTSVSENGGTSTATVTRNSTSGALTVNLASDDTTAATVPATVTIADGQTTSPAFTVTAVNDALVDGTQTATITATATGHVSGTDTLAVTDDDVATLTLTILASSIGEADGAGATTATVSRNTPTTAALTVNLISSDTSEATVPATVTIAAGQTTSAAFNIDAVDDALQDGDQSVTITASASGFANGTDTVSVVDDEVHTVIVSTDTDIDDNNLADGQLSLREAVRLANADADQSQIRFADSMVGSTILLTNGQFELTQNVSIIGPGTAGDLVINAQQNSRVFRISSGVTAGISRLSVTGGDADSNAEREFSGSIGGGILNAGGILTLEQVRVFNNVATWGGGINNYGDSGTATLTVRNSTIDQNTSRSNGGGLYNWGNNGQATANIEWSTVSQNTAQGSGGGGVASWPATTVLSVSNSSIVSNSATVDSGGLLLHSNLVTITNSTIAGNSAGTASGLGISPTAAVSLFNTVVAGNRNNSGTASEIGGSRSVTSASANNVIGDAATAGGLTNDTDGNPATGSNNIVGVDWKTVVVNDGTDPTLADNGGLTRTVALLPNSPAIDAGSDALAVDQNDEPLMTDQRAFQRILDGDNNGTATVDIGAVEAGQVAPITLEVNTNTDIADGDYSAGEFSLREAIYIANGRAGSDEISFATSLNNETITLGGTELPIIDSLTINGPGAGQLTIDGDLQSRIFNVSAAAGAVTLSGVTMTNGQTPAGEDGGAILSAAGSALVITDSVITNSNADGKGGGIRTTQSTVNISGSTIADNRSVTDSGGGVDAASGGTISNSTISGNRSQGVGGGVATGNSLTVVNSTVTGNTSNDDGGGVWVFGGDVRIMNSTFAGNSSDDDGGAAFIRSTVGKLTIHNSILAGNTGNTADVFSQAGTEDVRNSLIGDNSGLGLPTDGTNNNQVGVDWKTVLQNDGTDPILADNGGPTRTVALLPDSPAIDSGVVIPDALIQPTSATTSTIGDFSPVSQLLANTAITFENFATTQDGSLLSGWVTNDVNGSAGDYFANNTPAPVLTFNLGSLQTLTDVVIWGGTGDNNNDLKDFMLEFSSDGGSTFSSPVMLTKPRYSNSNFVHTLNLGASVEANFVRMTVTDNYFGESGRTGGDRVAFNEIRFLTRGLSSGTFDQRGTGYARVVDGDLDATATVDIGAFEFAPPVLSVTISEASISENGGTGTATVTRTGDTSTALIVNLASDTTTEATVPATVVIAAGQTTSPQFTITAVDDVVVDGDKTVTITASASGTVSGTDTIQITDDDTAALTLTIAAGSVGEGDGATATTATVSRNTDTTNALTVTLTSSDTTEATVPATVTIAAGQTTSPAFNIAAIDDAIVDGTQTVTITAAATGLTSGTDTLDVTDDEVAALTVTIAAASVSETAGATATTATVSRNGDTTAALTVTLTSSDTTEATVPATVTIAAGQTTSPAFNIAAIDDAIVDGTQTVTVTASATGLTSGTDTLDVTDDEIAALTVTIAAASVSETAGATATTATVSRNGDTTAALTVTLTSSDTTEATVPATVTIAAGQTTSPAFNIAAIDDAIVDGTQTVTITAAATGLTSGTDTLDVTDDDTGFSVTAPINRTDSKRPLITWTPVAGALSYDVWVNRASLGGEPVVNLVKREGLSANQASYQTDVDLEFGVYRIYVYANMPGGSQQESAPHTFIVDEKPVLTFLGATVDPRPTFTWSRVPGAANYVIFIGVAGGNVVETVAGPTSGTSVSYTLNATLPTNDFFWWVRPVRSNGFQGLWSEHSIVSTGGRTNLVSPARNSTITTTVPEFEWTAVPGATAYEVYVSKDGTPGALYRDPFITENRIRSRALGNGDYRAWIRSTLADGSTVWGRPVNFTINEPSISLTTTPVAPAAPGFDATPTFTWQPTSGATTYDILLHRGTESRLVTGLSGITFTPTTALSGGRWTWSIRPVNASGAGAWSTPLTFATDGTTTFLAPVSPTTDTTPTFTWQPVTGATRYSLVIFSGTSGTTQAFRDDNLTGTTTVIPPTEALPAGSYRVWVRAISGSTFGQWSLQFNLTITAVTPDGNDESPDTLLASLSSLLPETDTATAETVAGEPAATAWPQPETPPRDTAKANTKTTDAAAAMNSAADTAAIDDQFAKVTQWLSAI